MPARSKMAAVYWSYEVSIGHRSPRCLAASRSRVRIRWPAGTSLRDVDIVVSFRLEAAVRGPRVPADRPTSPRADCSPRWKISHRGVRAGGVSGAGPLTWRVDRVGSPQPVGLGGGEVALDQVRAGGKRRALLGGAMLPAHTRNAPASSR